MSRVGSVFYSVNLLRGSVSRSGFIGYFENNTGPHIRAAHAGLEEMGLNNVRDILHEAQKVTLGDWDLPTDDTPITVISHNSEEQYERESERIERALETVQKDFLKQEEYIWYTLLRYAAAHKLQKQS